MGKQLTLTLSKGLEFDKLPGWAARWTIVFGLKVSSTLASSSSLVTSIFILLSILKISKIFSDSGSSNDLPMSPSAPVIKIFFLISFFLL